MELNNGLDLSLHGLVDPETGHRINLNELLDGPELDTEPMTSCSSGSDRIMQVDGTTMMQVKFARTRDS